MLQDLSSNLDRLSRHSELASLDYAKANDISREKILKNESLGNKKEHKIPFEEAHLEQRGARSQDQLMQSRLLLKRKSDIATKNLDDIA